VKLSKESYFPGDEVNGEIHLRRADGEPLEEAPTFEFEFFVLFFTVVKEGV